MMLTVGFFHRKIIGSFNSAIVDTGHSPLVGRAYAPACSIWRFLFFSFPHHNVTHHVSPAIGLVSSLILPDPTTGVEQRGRVESRVPTWFSWNQLEGLWTLVEGGASLRTTKLGIVIQRCDRLSSAIWQRGATGQQFPL